MGKAVMPKVSIILATHNQASTLPLALNSLMDQTFSDTEIIAVAVETDDETKNILKNYPIINVESQKADFIHQRNLGIQKASGEYITFFDSDDFCLPTKMEQEVATAEYYKALLVYSTYIRCDATLTPLLIGYVKTPHVVSVFDIPVMPSPTYETLLQTCFIYDFALVHNSMYKEFGLLNVELKQAAMYDKWLHIMEKYPDRIVYNPNPTFLYRTYPEQMHLTEQKRPEHEEIMKKVRLESAKRWQATKTWEKV